MKTKDSNPESETIEQLARKVFTIPENEGEDKVTALKDAVRNNIKPGMTLFFSGPGNAVHYQIIREFWGKSPQFTIVFRLPTLGLDLVHCGLAKKIISSGFGETYPKPGLSRVFNRAFKDKKIETEIYSLVGFQLRLMAGAIGVGFMPTRLMVNSSMIEENTDTIKMMDDPFGSGKRVAIVKALNPDVTIVHALAADRYGNAILPAPAAGTGGPSYWASFASKNGVVLTTERLVSTAFIRQHSSLVKIPGYRVKSVSVLPMGAHPLGVYGWGMEEFEAYGDDMEFHAEHQRQAKDPKNLDSWIKEWVLDCPNHEDYLRKIGPDRIAYLKGKARKDFWEYELVSAVREVSMNEPCSVTEMMIIAAARKIQERVIDNKYKVITCGIGASGMAGWLAGYELKGKGYSVELASGNGMFGVLPRPGDPMLVNVANMNTCKMIIDSPSMYEFIIAGESKQSMAVLASGQIDKFGNLNSGKISEDLLLQGPGGAGDACKACEVVAVLKQQKDRFLDKVPYITSSGETVRTVVSSLGIFEKLGADTKLTLTACLPSAEQLSLDESVKNVKDNCGWDLNVSPKVNMISPPSFKELGILRLLDPDNVFRDQEKSAK